MNPDSVRREWARRTGTYSPEFYAHLGPNFASEAVRAALGERLGTDASVLELGCSCGRHLAHLAEAGFSDLHGVDVNGDAFDVMAEVYPGLRAEGTFHEGAIEDLCPSFDEDRYDAVFSVETLQHVHPDRTAVFDDVARVAGEFVLTVENEGGTNAGGASADERRAGPDEAVGAGDPGPDGDGPERTLVDGEFPLYYRDWGRVFGDRGLEQVAAERERRDVRRVFRVPDGR